MPLLQRWSDDVWVAAAPHKMMGLHLGTRMTVVRLPSGALLLHSPIAPSAELSAELDALGEVHHIVAPNTFHHVYAGAMRAAYPRATFHAPPELAKKRPDLKIDALLGEGPHAGWGGALEPLTIDGCMLHETVLVHPASRTVVSSDLMENFVRMDHAPTRLYLKASGVYGRVGWSRLLRFVYRDHAAARRSIERLLEKDFDRAIIAHGEPIERDAKAAIRETFRFL